MATLSGLIECVDKKKKKACLRAPSGKQWRAGQAEKGAHCCKGTRCSGTLAQVFWWIRRALCRESMHSGTKKSLGGSGEGVQRGTRHLLGFWPRYGPQVTEVLRENGELRRFRFKKRDSRFFHASRVGPNDKLLACWHVSGVTDGGRGGLYTPVSITNHCFFPQLFKPHHNKRFHVSFYLPCIWVSIYLLACSSVI